MPPKALSRFAERGAGSGKPPPTDERVGLFTPDKDGHTHTSCGRVTCGRHLRGPLGLNGGPWGACGLNGLKLA